jgi:hypothetical protein
LYCWVHMRVQDERMKRKGTGRRAERETGRLYTCGLRPEIASTLGNELSEISRGLVNPVTAYSVQGGSLGSACGRLLNWILVG